ncbi:MAG: hypothetical protein ACTS5A_02175 [Candidatus Hodgkinia cicadicola]
MMWRTAEMCFKRREEWSLRRKVNGSISQTQHSEVVTTEQLAKVVCEIMFKHWLTCLVI